MLHRQLKRYKAHKNKLRSN